jgi:hypothetical protein
MGRRRTVAVSCKYGYEPYVHQGYLEWVSRYWFIEKVNIVNIVNIFCVLRIIVYPIIEKDCGLRIAINYTWNTSSARKVLVGSTE